MALSPEEETQLADILNAAHLPIDDELPMGNPPFEHVTKSILLGFGMSIGNDLIRRLNDALYRDKCKGLFFDEDAKEWRLDSLDINLN